MCVSSSWPHYEAKLDVTGAFLPDSSAPLKDMQTSTFALKASIERLDLHTYDGNGNYYETNPQMDGLGIVTLNSLKWWMQFFEGVKGGLHHLAQLF